MTPRNRYKIGFGIGLLIALVGLGVEAIHPANTTLAIICAVVGVILVIGGATAALSNAFSVAFHRGEEPEPTEPVTTDTTTPNTNQR